MGGWVCVCGGGGGAGACMCVWGGGTGACMCGGLEGVCVFVSVCVRCILCMYVCMHVQVMVLTIFFLVENLDTHVSTVLSHSFPLDVSILYSCWPVGYCLGTRGKNMLQRVVMVTYTR